LAALRAHWSGVTSEHFEIDPDVSGQSDDGFVIRSKADPDDQYSWHRISATTATVINDPTGSISAAGAYQSAPTGAHASKSSPVLSNFTYSGAAKLLLIEFPGRFYTLSLSSAGGVNGTAVSLHGYGRCGVPKSALASQIGARGKYLGDLVSLSNSRIGVADNGTQAENWIAPTESFMGASGLNPGAPTTLKVGASYLPQGVEWGQLAARRLHVCAVDLVRMSGEKAWPSRDGSADGQHTYLYVRGSSDSMAIYFDAAAALPTF
jgi:hypothetical protein